MTIRILDRSVVERIAAGEVIERPASVVKELIENALDAGSTAIHVEILDGGLSYIRVSDNGCGMTAEDAVLALERFATSKISSSEDLDKIRTLGFRGEALPSIASVSRLELVTRASPAPEGRRLIAEGGAVTVEAAASPVGTSVTVRDLFYNTPARRKFLKSPLREAELVQRTVLRYALAYPQVAFRLTIDRRESLVLPQGKLLDRIAALWGREVASEMLEVQWEGVDLHVWGYVSRPTIAKASREFQHLFVNGRPVRPGFLSVAIERPYHGLLPPGRHPLAVLSLVIHPSLVDVNVHPQKAEIRFLQERSVYWAISQAIGKALSRISPEEIPQQAWPFPESRAEEVRETPTPYIGDLRVLGQLHHTYILAIDPQGLWIVDQHAAHEQVLFERILKNPSPVILSPPVSLQVPPREGELLRTFQEVLEAIGVEMEPFGGQTILIRSVPEVAKTVDLTELLVEIGGVLDRYRGSLSEHLREQLAMKVACIAAYKSGDPLTREQMQSLLDELQTAWSPATCPHGRPTFVILSVEELERRFLRR
ncbi:MAG: DNA mismatch repair endonuclease MutL [Armatimonadota bacterium]|nr:DNA mismatch repair endonuclease MutL [Armatimonadota bacterium]